MLEQTTTSEVRARRRDGRCGRRPFKKRTADIAAAFEKIWETRGQNSQDLTNLVNLACDRYGQLDVRVAEFTDCPICLPIVNAPP